MTGVDRSARGSIMCSAAIRSAWPLASVEDGVDNEAVAVLHQRMCHEAELCFLARPLAVKPRLRIGGGDVRLVGALLTMEIGLAVRGPPPDGGGWSDPVSRPKLFIDAPGFDQRAIDREMIRLSGRFTRGCAITALNSLAAISPSSSRSRFLENVQ